MKDKDYQTKVLFFGFARVEKILLWNLLANNFQVTAIVSDADVKKLAYFLEYDSFHGKFNNNPISKVVSQKIKGKQKLIFEFSDKKKEIVEIIPTKEATLKKLKSLNVDFTINCSDKNIQIPQIKNYLKWSKKVIVTANKDLISNKESFRSFAFAFNHNKFNVKDKVFLIPPVELVVSAILIKSLQERLKIESSSLEIFKGFSNDMNFLDTLDTSLDSSFVSGRSIIDNIIPANSLQEEALLESLLKEDINIPIKIQKTLLPVGTGNLLKLYFQIKKIYKVLEVNDLFNQCSDAQVGFSLQPLTAKDIETMNYYGVIDKNLTSILSAKNNQIVSLGVWFDNETSTSVCFLRTIQFLAGELAKSL